MVLLLNLCGEHSLNATKMDILMRHHSIAKIRNISDIQTAMTVANEQTHLKEVCRIVSKNGRLRNKGYLKI